jgi:S1-C subfamily serine protease
LQKRQGPARYAKCIIGHLASIGLTPGQRQRPRYVVPGPPARSSGKIENERLKKENTRLRKENQSRSKQVTKRPPPARSSGEIENERLKKENARLRKEKQSRPKQVVKRPPPKSRTSGSGFFISKKGHVITNEHVVSDCRKVTIGDNSKKQVAANVLETDKRNDLALLKISSLKMASVETKSLIRKLGISVVPLASDGLMRSDDVELGEDVLVAGYPYGEVFSNSIKVTKGIVSANRGLGDDVEQFQIDAAVQPGNSGGPIYDENGNIVGVVVSQLNKMKFAKATGSMPENVNFGIKASTVRQFLNASGLPTKWSKRSKRMNTRELAKIAKNQTVMVMCHR